MSKTYYSSKNANTGPVEEVRGEIEGNYFIFAKEGRSRYANPLMDKKFAHETRELAELHAKQLRQSKIKSLEKQIQKLKAMDGVA